MYFYEVLASGNRNLIIEEFFKLFGEEEQIDIEGTKIKLIGAMDAMSKIKPNLSADYTIYASEVENEYDNSTYDDVWAWNKNKYPKYAIEFNQWADTLGYLVDDDSLKKYGADKFSALVLWEMTWAGYDEESIRKHTESWEE